jgi:hypothetical protein
VTDTVVEAPHTGNHTVFLSGPPGAGKTTLAVERLRYLLAQGIPAEQVLVFVPQRTLATPYYEALSSADTPAGGQVDVATIGGLARRSLELFWPLVSEPAGFAQPAVHPRFLTLETAQYHMDHVLEPFVAQGAFDGITIPRARLVSQIIDNLNKAAAVGFEPDQIAARLKGAWGGESSRLRIYDQVQAVALAFRHTCLESNLLDWSLQIQVFGRYLLPLSQVQRYLLGGYRHLVADNTEEDIPVAHDLLGKWLSLCESALVVHDTDGGYRVFLGADPAGALGLGSICHHKVVLTGSHVMSPQVAALGQHLAAPFAPSQGTSARNVADSVPTADAKEAAKALRRPSEDLRFHPQMLDWVADQVSSLVREEGIPPGEVAILAPFLSDALRFSLGERMKEFHLPVRSHRPSRPLREEPATRCLLTLARLAHPGWYRPPPLADVAHTLALAIDDMDPVRARLLTDVVYRIRDGKPELAPWHQIVPEMQQRISYLLGGRYSELWQWTEDYVDLANDGDRLDHFLSRLFGELLSQPGFGFHHDLDAGATAANLIESVQKFRQGFRPQGTEARQSADSAGIARMLGREYVDMVERGVVAAQYVSSWQVHSEDAVILVPAYTFLMMNRPVSIQFWLDAGSGAWAERIYQPLTHPHVLRRDWVEGKVWSDEDEVRVRDDALVRLIQGLAARCRDRIYLAYSDLNERGYEQQGPLLQAVQSLLRAQEQSGS